MTQFSEEMIREIIRDELSTLIKSDRFTFEKLIQILDGRSIQVGLTTGSQIATSDDQKLAFHNQTPCVRANHIADPSGGGTQDAEARTAVNAILVALENKGILKTS